MRNISFILLYNQSIGSSLSNTVQHVDTKQYMFDMWGSEKK